MKEKSAEGWSTKKKVGVGVLGFFVFLIVLGGIITVFQKPNFSVTDLEVTPSQTNPNEQVTISVIVRNTGEASGTYEANLKINGEVVDREAVSLESGENQKIKFEVSKETEGDYNVEIGGLTDSFTVQKQAKLVVKDFQVEPKTVDTEESATVTATVKNEGQLEGSKEYKLKINGDIVDSEEITLKSGESGDINFEITRSEEGIYSLNLAGFSRDLEVKKMFLKVLDTKWDDIFLYGRVFKVKVRLYNNKANDVFGGNETIELSYLKFSSEEGGIRTKTKGMYEACSLSDAPGKIQADGEAVFWVIFDEVPRDAQFTEIVYDAPAEKAVSAEIRSQPKTGGAKFEVSDLQIKPKKVELGQPVTVTVDVKNIGREKGSKTLKFSINGETKTRNITLEPDKSTSVSFSIKMEEEGTYPVEVENLSQTFKVESPTGWLPVTSFNGSMPSDTLDKTDTFQITEENWRINWKVEKIPFTPDEAVIVFSVVREDEVGKIGGNTVTLLYEDLKEGSLNFHQKGKFHIKLLGKYVDWRFEIEEFADEEKDNESEENTVFTSETILSRASGGIEAIDFSPNNEYIAYGSKDSKVYVHSTEDWSLVSSFTESFVKVRELEFSPNDKYIAFTYKDKSNLYVYSTSNWNRVATLSKSGGEVKNFTFSPNSEYIAYSSQDTNVYVHSTVDWSNVASFTRPSLPTWGVTFSPDGQYFAFGEGHYTYNQAQAYVYSVGDWNNLATFSAGGWVRGIDFTSNSNRMAFCSNDGKVRIYSTGTWEKNKTLTTGKKVRHVDFSPDGEMISYGADSTAYVSSTSEWSLKRKFTNQSRYIFNTTFSPDSKYFVFNSSGDEKVLIYSAEDWSKIEVFDSIRGRFDFSPDGSLFAVQNGEIVHVYEVD